jgi:pimeloyl-ACP methyl ester carboxylesterase
VAAVGEHLLGHAAAARGGAFEHGADLGDHRSYWENTQAAGRAAGQPRPEVKVPAGFTTFPGEIWRTPRSWAEKSYPTLSYFNEVDKGGHFAAWEEPELFATEIRAAFRPLR